MKKDGSLNTSDWENDRQLVMTTGAKFPVKLLGVVDVEKGRGVEVCEAAIYSLKGNTKTKRKLTLIVRADGLRSMDEDTNEVVFDQPIEKVSFCSPFPGHTRLFSYISRDTATKKWICHCFASLKEPGERICHAMGCSFTACMRRQQARLAELNKQRAAKKAKQAEDKLMLEAEQMPVSLGLSSGAELLFDDIEFEDMPDPSQMASAPVVEEDKTTVALEEAIAKVEQALQLAKIKSDEAGEQASGQDVVTDVSDIGEKKGDEAAVISVSNVFTDFDQ